MCCFSASTSALASSSASAAAFVSGLLSSPVAADAPRELRRHLRATGVEEKNIKALIATMDKDKNGSIDRDEFTAGFAHFLSGGVAGPINRRRSKP